MKALCIHTNLAPKVVQDAIYDATAGRHVIAIDLAELNAMHHAFMVDRAICDTKATDNDAVAVAESTLQLLPYMVLRSPSGKIYHYSRGKGGAEDRLKKNTSVGVGGHVDAVPPEGIHLVVWLQMEAAREVFEEVGIDVPAASIQFTHYIVDRTNAVGRVHLGLFAVVDVPDEAVQSAEPDMLLEDGFFAPGVLFQDPAYAKMENWSQMVVTQMLNDAAVQAEADLDAAADVSYSLGG